METASAALMLVEPPHGTIKYSSIGDLKQINLARSIKHTAIKLNQSQLKGVTIYYTNYSIYTSDNIL